MEVVDKLQAKWGDRDLPIVAGDNAAAAAADVVVIATPWDGAYGTATSVADALDGKVVICMANALTRIGKEFQPLVPPRGSVAASVQAAVPACHGGGGFHHVPAKELGDLSHPIESDVLICSDFPDATEVTSDIVAKVPNLRPLDAGGLSQATPIESFTAVLLQLNVHYKTRVAVKFTGIPDRLGGRRRRPGRRRRRRAGGHALMSSGPMRLYDTARQVVVPFEPGPVVTMYTCGITPYDATHIGHAATYLTYDVLQRRLRDLGHETRCVRNITDVDDDLLRKARELGVHYLDLAAGEIARFDADMEALGLLPSWSEPRATSAIADIRGFIGMVLDRGHAYESGGSVYFDVASWEASARSATTTATRCCAWPPSAAATPTTPTSATRWTSCSGSRRPPTSRRGSRCGVPGGPGWHIECSALACASWAPPSTCTAAAATSSSRTTSASRRSPRPPPASRSCATGCTRPWSAWTARRCRSRSATWCS
jgi:NADPH-dependent F420 reductase